MSRASERLYRRRSLVNGFNMVVSGLCAAFGLFWLVWILWTTLRTGLSAISLDLFTRMTPPPGSEGGLANALFGSLLMSTAAILIGTPTDTHADYIDRAAAAGKAVLCEKPVDLSSARIVKTLERPADCTNTPMGAEATRKPLAPEEAPLLVNSKIPPATTVPATTAPGRSVRA